MIQNTRDKWFQSKECTVNSIIEYIENTNKLRDAQVGAIKTYLFLKIACGCKPLGQLFKEGKFNSLNLEDLEVSNNTRKFLQDNPAAAALYEYAMLKDDSGKQISKNVEELIKKEPENIDYEKFFDEMFYNVDYTDYLFSLPMGAGKTFLMAMFIYLDLYFAKNEPNNDAFAHNFIIFAPSGTKSSIIPSLKTIQDFDPSWILPEPAASNIKKEIFFELLDQPKSANRSNKTKNPNVDKIASHQPYADMFGLVAVTNAEKVILDRITEENAITNLVDLFNSEDDKDRAANELRNTIGKIPSMSIFVDEVHHAVSEDIKLRAVINNWQEKNKINSIIGFSGTPYLQKPNKIAINDSLVLSNSEISTIVYYYPLVNGVGNFLKRPVIKISDNKSRNKIIEKGVRDFLDNYKNKKYNDGTCAKLGIYCGTIASLEEEVYPIVDKIVAEYGLSRNCILKFHRGDSKKKYPQPQDSELEFQSLDQPFSKKKIVLLVQIGKEGWDCKSLTGIILSQTGDCPKNMVLQTSCRCLRQVDSKDEQAIIWLNQDNAKKLDNQLKKEHNSNIDEFQNGITSKKLIKRYDRTKYLNLPKVDFYQLRVKFSETVVDKANPKKEILNSIKNAKLGKTITEITDIQMKNKEILTEDIEGKNIIITFEIWKNQICKQSFNTLSVEELNKHNKELKKIFEEITHKNNNVYVFDSKYDINLINQNIRKAFCDKRDYKTTEETISQSCSLLNVQNFREDVYTDYPEKYFPDENQTKLIHETDKSKKSKKEDIEYTIQNLRDMGGEVNNRIADDTEKANTPYLNRHISYHYIPYKSDSNFEIEFHEEMLRLKLVKDLNLEVYYNGDRNLTDFKIACYKNTNGKWTYLGMYTPDFLIVQRKDKEIHKAIIVETKGEIYSNDPMFIAKKEFVESEFIRQNNEKFKYKKFDYLYLESSLTNKERIYKVVDLVNSFFN